MQVLVAAVVACAFPTGDAVAPVRGEVVSRYAAPSCARCAGRRGITVDTGGQLPVVATRSGRITFAGDVAGVLWVVQEVAPNVRVTYGRLSSIAPGVSEGVEIPRGATLGGSSGRVHLGVRRGERYTDPLPCWAKRVRLVPVPDSVVGAFNPSR